MQDYTFLYQRDIVPGEAVDLTGDVGHSVRDADDGDEYQSSSSAEKEEFQEDESQTLSTLLGRVSTFGRAVRFNHRQNGIDIPQTQKTT